MSITMVATMKKTTFRTKLVLDKQTIRVLLQKELTPVVAGAGMDLSDKNTCPGAATR
jgi:hypothetical protein